MEQIKQHNLVFLSYGSVVEYNRALFALFSYCAWTGKLEEKTRVIIYTDEPAYFQTYLGHLTVIYIHLTEQLLTDLIADTGNIHRRKIRVVQLTFEQWPHDHLLFIDSDTFFIADPAPLVTALKEGKYFMHKREYSLEEGVKIWESYGKKHYPEAILKFITDTPLEIDGKKEYFSEADDMWNSGLLAINSAASHLMPDMVKLTDSFYTHSKWFVSEQLAFSFVLNRKFRVLPANHFLLHYWGKRQKLMFDGLLARLFAENTPFSLSKPEMIRTVIRKWQPAYLVDQLLEQAVLAFERGNWTYGIKKSVQVLIKKPVAASLYTALYRSIKQGIKSRSGL